VDCLLALQLLIKSLECAFFVPISELPKVAVDAVIPSDISKSVFERQVIMPPSFTEDASSQNAEKWEDKTIFLTGPMNFSTAGLQKSAFRCVLLVIYVSSSIYLSH
jgi:hypothetical protein